MKNELLEKMQYLHECGFVPDMWYQRCYIDGSNSWIYCKQAIAEFSCHPYFTESCLWRILQQEYNKYTIYPGQDLLEWLLDETIQAFKAGRLVPPSKAEVQG